MESALGLKRIDSAHTENHSQLCEFHRQIGLKTEVLSRQSSVSYAGVHHQWGATLRGVHFYKWVQRFILRCPKEGAYIIAELFSSLIITIFLWVFIDAE